jgi:molybdopterin-guanine dinucleotide biosynthesis protein A
MNAGGIVLCGGRSSRMGRPKAWLPFGNELMLQRVVRVLRTVVDPVVVVAAPRQSVPRLPADVHVVRDEVEGKGPLGGLATGLSALGKHSDVAYLSSCDVPFLRPEFIHRVLSFLTMHKPALASDNRTPEPLIAVPQVDHYLHPLAAAYHRSILPQVTELLNANRLRPIFLFDLAPTRIITPAELTDCDPELASLRNINTPEQYELALQEFTE